MLLWIHRLGLRIPRQISSTTCFWKLSAKYRTCVGLLTIYSAKKKIIKKKGCFATNHGVSTRWFSWFESEDYVGVVVGTCSSNFGVTFVKNPPRPWSARKVSRDMHWKIMSVRICLENVGQLCKSQETSSAARGQEQRSSLAHSPNNKSKWG